MENIILGLLLLQPRTIYELRKRINSGLNLMYSCSTGSIQAAIKKLLQKNNIRFEAISENGKLKKKYYITESGKFYFNSWVNSSIEIDTAKIPELSKIYFMGFAKKEARIETIKKYLSDLKEKAVVLENIYNEGQSLTGKMQENEIFYYQFQTVIYGRDFIQFNINWYTSLLENIKGKNE